MDDPVGWANVCTETETRNRRSVASALTPATKIEPRCQWVSEAWLPSTCLRSRLERVSAPAAQISGVGLGDIATGLFSLGIS